MAHGAWLAIMIGVLPAIVPMLWVAVRKRMSPDA